MLYNAVMISFSLAILLLCTKTFYEKKATTNSFHVVMKCNKAKQ